MLYYDSPTIIKVRRIIGFLSPAKQHSECHLLMPFRLLRLFACIHDRVTVINASFTYAHKQVCSSPVSSNFPFFILSYATSDSSSNGGLHRSGFACVSTCHCFHLWQAKCAGMIRANSREMFGLILIHVKPKLSKLVELERAYKRNLVDNARASGSHH